MKQIYVIITVFVVFRRTTNAFDTKHRLLIPSEDTEIVEDSYTPSLWSLKFTSGEPVPVNTSYTTLVGLNLSAPFILTATFKSFTNEGLGLFSILADEHVVMGLYLETVSNSNSRVFLASELYTPASTSISFLTNESYKDKWMKLVIYVKADDTADLYVNCIKTPDTLKLTRSKTLKNGMLLTKDLKIQLAYFTSNLKFRGLIEEISLYTDADDTSLYYICDMVHVPPDNNQSISELLEKLGTNEQIKTLFTPGQKDNQEPMGPLGQPGMPGMKGDMGLAGPVGPPGMPGMKGDMGLEGPVGPPGRPGMKGDMGLEGPVGPPGMPGMKGDMGLEGLVGPPGRPGMKGDMGLEGLVGPPGMPGIKGDMGLDGLVGPPGMQGMKGNTGLDGLVGPPGMQGMKGDRGYPGPKGKMGFEGPAGPQGIPGMKGHMGLEGPKGNMGYAGPVGPQGMTGMKGDMGLEGPKGNMGLAGPLGPRGMPGMKGDIGLEGPVGPQGIPGMPGTPGMKGDMGLEGPVGPQGSPGYKGENGRPGDTGFIGEKGEKGNQGRKGNEGPAGVQGDKGESGFQGRPGARGFIGPSGSKGDRGDDGMPGRDGLPASLKSVLDAENADVVEKLRGFKGEMGETGSKGEKGERSEAVVKGEPGQIGEKGEKGERGIDGPRGAKGDSGPVGPQGLWGPPGRDGDMGPKGEKGSTPEIDLSKGEKGVIGEPGMPGAVGPQGAPGICVVGPPGPPGQLGPPGESVFLPTTATSFVPTTTPDVKHTLLIPPVDAELVDNSYTPGRSSYKITSGEPAAVNLSETDLVGLNLSAPFMVTAIFKSTNRKPSCLFSITQNERIVMSLCIRLALANLSRVTLFTELYSPEDSISLLFNENYKDKWIKIVLYVKDDTADLYVNCIKQSDTLHLVKNRGVLTKDMKIDLGFSVSRFLHFEGFIEDLNLRTNVNDDALLHVCKEARSSFTSEGQVPINPKERSHPPEYDLKKDLAECRREITYIKDGMTDQIENITLLIRSEIRQDIEELKATNEYITGEFNRLLESVEKMTTKHKDTQKKVFELEKELYKLKNENRKPEITTFD